MTRYFDLDTPRLVDAWMPRGLAVGIWPLGIWTNGRVGIGAYESLGTWGYGHKAI